MNIDTYLTFADWFHKTSLGNLEDFRGFRRFINFSVFMSNFIALYSIPKVIKKL